MPRFALAVIAGAVVAWVGFETVKVNDIPYAAATTGIAGFSAGFLARRLGAVAGFASVLIAWLAWDVHVLADSWRSGALFATSGCDPCGPVGYAVRMGIVMFMMLSTFGVVGAFTGWLGEHAQRRFARRGLVRRLT